MTISDDASSRSESERFLSRWSRMKREAAAQPSAPTQNVEKESKHEPVVLPPIESLTPESDFSPFMKAEVDPDLRRAALKKLFGDPHFNVMDGLDIYIDDYNKPDPLPAAVAAGLVQFKNLFGVQPEEAKQSEMDGAMQQVSLEPSSITMPDEGKADFAKATTEVPREQELSDKKTSPEDEKA